MNNGQRKVVLETINKLSNSSVWWHLPLLNGWLELDGGPGSEQIHDRGGQEMSHDEGALAAEGKEGRGTESWERQRCEVRSTV